MGPQSSDPLSSSVVLITLTNWKVEGVAIYLALARFVALVELIVLHSSPFADIIRCKIDTKIVVVRKEMVR